MHYSSSLIKAKWLIPNHYTAFMLLMTHLITNSASGVVCLIVNEVTCSVEMAIPRSCIN